ncbi:hypothetical protein HDU67_001358 [Dinochytrium kinnereticum]|nr:hypothetical protein HDU67_001358 [Dinochytrium kinnereticum]
MDPNAPPGLGGNATAGFNNNTAIQHLNDVTQAMLDMQRRVISLQDQLNHANTTAAQAAAAAAAASADSGSRSRRLAEFKATSKKPPTFDGELKKKAAHDAQAIIDNYLHTSSQEARLHDFLGDNETPRYENHKTYVDWVSTGLEGQAMNQWRRLPEPQRHSMTWEQYSDWIQTRFSSKLTLTQAVDALDDLKQKGSAVSYTQNFNEIIAALRSCEVNLPASYLTCKYRKGLKDHLRQNKDLFSIETDLEHLQEETERFDDFYWRGRSQEKDKDKDNSQKKKGQNQPFRQGGGQNNTQNGPTPMEIDTVKGNQQTQRTKLTEEEKRQYEKNGWCKYCRAHDHTIDKCSASSFKKKATVNNVEATVDRAKVLEIPRGDDPQACPLPHKTKISATVKTQRKKESFMLSSIHVEEKDAGKELLIMEGLIRKRPIRILIDGGATPSYINEKLAQEIKSKPTDTDFFNIALAGEDQADLEGRLHTKLDLQIEGYREKLDLVSAKIAYDVILGKDWLANKIPKSTGRKILSVLATTSG